MAKCRKLDFSLPKTPWTPIISHHLELNILSLLKSRLKLAIWKPSVSSSSHITSENSRSNRSALPIVFLCFEFLLLLLDGSLVFRTWVTLYLGHTGLFYAPSIVLLYSLPCCCLKDAILPSCSPCLPSPAPASWPSPHPSRSLWNLSWTSPALPLSLPRTPG